MMKIRFKKIVAFVSLIYSTVILYAQDPDLVVPVGHNAWITSYAISPNEKFIATGAYDNMVKLWDLKYNRELATLVGHNDVVGALAFSKDSRMIASGSWDGNIKIWSVQEKRVLLQYNHYDIVNSLAFSPDGKYLASVANDSLLFIYSLQEDSIVGGTHVGAIGLKLKFTPDSKTLFVLDDDLTEGTNTLGRFNIAENTFDYDLSLSYRNGNILDFDIINQGKWIASLVGTDSGQIRIFDIKAQKDITRFNGHKNWPEAIAGTATGDFLYTQEVIKSVSNDPVESLTIIKKWNTKNNKCVDSIQLNSGITEAHGLFLAPSQRKLVVPLRSTRFAVLKEGPLQLSDVSKSITSLLNNIVPVRNNYWVMGNDEGLILTGQISPVPFLKPLYNNGLREPVHFKLSKDSSSVYILNLGKNRGIKKLQLETGALTDWLKTDTLVNNFTIDENENYLAYTYGDMSLNRSAKGICIVELNTFKTIADTVINVGGLLWGGYFFDKLSNRIVITHNWTDTIFSWNFKTGEMRYLVKKRPRSAPSIPRLISENRFVNGYYGQKGLYVWNLDSLKITDSLETSVINPEITYYDPKRGIIFMEQRDGTVKLLDDRNFLTRHTIPAVNSNISQIGFTGEDNMVYVYSLDNFFRFWNLQGNRMMYHFIPVDSTNFIALDNNGFYYATTTASKKLYYVKKDYKVITFEQLDVKYNRPDKVLEAIGNTDTAMIKSYRKAWEKRIKKLGIDTTQFRDGYSVPEADIINRDSIAYEQKTGTLRLHIKGTDSTYKLDRFNVWVNESPLYGQRGISIRKKNKNSLDTTITITLSQGENRIETSITNLNGTESYRMPLYVNYTPAVKQKEMTRFIGIGIDQFKENQHNLQYSSKDVRDLAVKLKEKYKDNIIIDTLFNEDVTTEKVKALKQKLQQTTVNDKVIISYSGHGLLSKDYDYYLSTYSVNFSKPEENGLPYDELENLLDSIPARKKLLLIDACHSGEVDKEEGIAMNKLADSLGLSKGIIIDQPQHVGLKNSFELMQSLFVNVGKSTGATIISAAAGNQFALERGDLKNGVFTYSLLEAMNQYPTIKISELKKIVGERVQQLTNGMQKPTSRNENIAVDWSLW